jgi:DNA-binding NtrC family response regulator
MEYKTKILIVDDETLIRQTLRKICEDEGFDVFTAGSAVKALRSIEENSPDIAILDIYLPDANGIDLLKTLKQTYPDLMVITITGKADIHSAVEAMKAGAIDYLEKPIDFEKLKSILKKTIQKKPVSHQKKIDISDFIFSSQKMKEIVRITENLAVKSDITVLLLGESGTGKNFIARKLHEWSSRKDKPFVEIGCTNIPAHLIESELFGYEKGAFTDAKSTKQGLIEMAEGGTVFLDEIGDMPYTMQSKILSLIEEKRFRKIGGLNYIKTNVRIIAATNRDLYALVSAKKFRLDLYYRLNVATIEIPPLRERREDIPLLIDFYLDYFSKKYNLEQKRISDEALNCMVNYSWPGNVRELKNLIEKLSVLTRSNIIEVSDLPEKMIEQDVIKGLPTTDLTKMKDNSEGFLSPLNALEIDYIKKALEVSGGNQKKAAQLLGISRDTLRYRLKKWGIKLEDKSEG